MEREAVFVVVWLLVLAVIVVQEARLRARLDRLERATPRLVQAITDVQGWAEQELLAVRSAFTIADDEPQGPRDTLATPAPVTAGATGPKPGDDDGEATRIMDGAPLMLGERLPTIRPPAPLAEPAYSDATRPPVPTRPGQ